MLHTLVLFITLPAFVGAATQVPLTFGFPSNHDEFEHDFYQFKWPMRRVAIVDAGVGFVVPYFSNYAQRVT